jgi:hypothetical protein
VRPAICGAIFEAAARALLDIDKVILDRPGSMADFEKWSITAAPGLGWTGDQFKEAYRRNRSAVGEDAFEADAFAVAIHNYTISTHPEGWEASPAAMQTELDSVTPEHIRASRSWPKTPAN